MWRRAKRKYTGTLEILQLSDTRTQLQSRVGISRDEFKVPTLKRTWHRPLKWRWPVICLGLFTNSLWPCNPISQKIGTALLLRVSSKRQDCDIEILLRNRKSRRERAKTHCRVTAHSLFACAWTLATGTANANWSHLPSAKPLRCELALGLHCPPLWHKTTAPLSTVTWFLLM